MIDRTSADTLEAHIRGRLVADTDARVPQDVVAQIFSRDGHQDAFIVPAVAEPLIVWILKGAATIEERDPGGAWVGHDVTAGDFFLIDSGAPYELRWDSPSGEPFEVMHLHLGLPLLERAALEAFGVADRIMLDEVSGSGDEDLASHFGVLHRELIASREPSSLLVESVGQALAVHLVRNYRASQPRPIHRRSAMTAFGLRKVLDRMQADLADDFDLARYATEAGMSVAHFSRQFKRSTGLPPSQYFIRMRMALARQQLRETDRSVISIGMEVGYLSPSHFAQVFRREVGVSPSAYRVR